MVALPLFSVRLHFCTTTRRGVGDGMLYAGYDNLHNAKTHMYETLADFTH